MKPSNLKWSVLGILAGLSLLGLIRVFNSYLDQYVAQITSGPRSSPPTLKKFTNSIGVRLVHLPGGTFKMGDGASDQPVHDVTIYPLLDWAV
jgi:formylglycine-generating enzyme required for sulfatase activity